MLLELTTQNITVLDFNELFINHYQTDILNHLYNFKMLNLPISNKDVQKIFYHCLIHGVCESVMGNNKSKPVFLYNNTQLDDCIIKDYYTEQELLEFFNSFFYKLDKMLPVRVYKSKYNTVSLKNLIDTNDARASLVINGLVEKNKEYQTKDYTFEKIKRFSKKYQLQFLSNDYFNRLKTKQILI